MDASVNDYSMNHSSSSANEKSKFKLNKRLLRFFPFIIGFVIIAIIAILLIRQINLWMTEGIRKPKQTIHVISLIKPPPPPEIEKIPEQEIQQKIETPLLDEPIPEMPENLPTSELLGMDAEGGAGDGFGIVGRKGGRSLLDGDQFGWYKQIMSTVLSDALNKIATINKRSYSVDIKVWVTLTGTIVRFQIVKGTGNKEIDREILKGIPTNLSLGQQRPPGMEQTVTIRIVSRK